LFAQECDSVANMTWLLTGGAGYIGTHVLRALQSAGLDVVVLDDLSSGLRERVPDEVPFVHASVLNQVAVAEALQKYRITGVIHLAAKKAVGESAEQPVYYFRENFGGLMSLLEAMAATGVNRLVYSSSAAVYGESGNSPITEDAAAEPISPYGQTKLAGEWLIGDVGAAHPHFSWVALRYFNVAGAGQPELGDTSFANLIPIVLGNHAERTPSPVFGNDYETPDGTCLRDYIHVVDLASAHVAAAQLTQTAGVGEVLNIGTGHGSSVLDVINSIGRATGQVVPFEVTDRRAGDPADLVADVARAKSILGWTASHDLDDMTRSAVQAAAHTSAHT
jgi:UDP-glucose 4-epimerase